MLTLLRELKPLLRLDALTVTGRTLGEEIERAGAGFAQDVVRPLARPIYPQGGIAVLEGNLAPGGAIIKQSAATPALMEHEGRAVVFENAQDLANRLDDPGARRQSGRHPGAEEHRAQGCTRACRKRAICRSRRSSPARALKTWCGSPTGA